MTKYYLGVAIFCLIAGLVNMYAFIRADTGNGVNLGLGILCLFLAGVNGYIAKTTWRRNDG